MSTVCQFNVKNRQFDEKNVNLHICHVDEKNCQFIYLKKSGSFLDFKKISRLNQT